MPLSCLRELRARSRRLEPLSPRAGPRDRRCRPGPRPDLLGPRAPGGGGGLHGRRFPFAFLAHGLARPHAKLFLLNSPVNPTGQLYTAAELEALLQVCVEHRIYFVLDRRYWRIVFEDQNYPEPRLDDETQPWLVQVDGMSKNFRQAGGLR